MKKKITAALLCAVMVLSLAGCNGNNEEPDDDDDDKPRKDKSSYSEDVNSTEDSKPDESKPNESDPDESKPTEGSKGSSTESTPESKPEEKPEALKVDWSSVPVVDEMDLDYTFYEADKINFRPYADWLEDEMKEEYKNGVVIVTKYFGDAEYINLPDQIEGKSCILVSSELNWGDNAKAIRFSEGFSFPINGFSTTDRIEYRLGAGTAANVTEAVVPDSWRYIGGFSSLPKLESINIPGEVRRIWGGAFEGCKALKSVTIPENIEYIYQNAFSGCTALETVNFPKKVVGECAIYKNAFEGCTSLKSVEIPEGVTELGTNEPDPCGVFQNCNSLEKVSLPSTLKEIKMRTFADCTSLTEVTLSEGLETIGSYAFNGCTSLSEIKLPTGLKTIGVGAFGNCTSLKEIDIPDSVMLINSYSNRGAFAGCTDISINYKGKTYTEKNVEKLYDKDLSTM